MLNSSISLLLEMLLKVAFAELIKFALILLHLNDLKDLLLLFLDLLENESLLLFPHESSNL